MNKLTSGIIIAVLVIVVFSIYWFGVRPGQVREMCWEQAKTHASNISDNESRMEEKGLNITRVDFQKVRDDDYRDCLLRRGLSK